jgi:NitT/TauT family transport system substrate-binding protein
MRRTISSILGLLLCAGLAFAPAGAQMTTIKVGWCAKTITSAAAPFAIATKMGWFRDAGINVELVPLPGSSDCAKLVATGDLMFALPSIEPVIPLRLQGVKEKVFYTAYQGNIYGLVVPAGSPIKSVKDLRGKRIGVASMASGAVPVARALLAQNGIDPQKDAQIVVVGEAGQAAALVRAHQVDALSIYDTQYALIQNAGVPLRPLDMGALARYPSNGFLALEETLAKNRAQALGLARGYAMGTIFALANPEAAVKVLYDVFPQTKPTGKTEQQAIHDDVLVLDARAEHWKLEAGGVKRWGESNVREFDAYEDFLLKQGVIAQKVPATDLVTNELIADVNRIDAGKIVAAAKAYR